jgi:hypothetical protein
MPLHAALRIFSILITGAIVSRTNDIVWASVFWSLAFVHYALALFYSRRRIALVAGDAHSLIPAVGIACLGTALYLGNFSLLIYFGIHHVFNEVYLWSRSLSLEANSTRGRALTASALLVNSLLYITLLRHYSELSWIDPALLFVGLGASYFYFFVCLYRAGALQDLTSWIKSAGFEIFGILLVLISLNNPIDLNYIVFYHFVFWSLYPIDKFYELGHGALNRYVVTYTVLFGVFALFSPMGFGSRVTPEYFYYEQFVFWSFVHITVSFFLSDAHPPWITRWFRPRTIFT